MCLLQELSSDAKPWHRQDLVAEKRTANEASSPLRQLLSQRFHVARNEGTERDRRALLSVAAEAESVLLDPKAAVRACVNVSNQDEPP
jgi:hypothetical protein